jgi:YfiH family protein
VLVADCLPVLLAVTDEAGQALGVGAAHAGWRGLAGGVLEATLAALCEATGSVPARAHAWLGACIGPERFEVGEDVRQAFEGAPATCFRPTGAVGKWWADLPALAQWRLQCAGVTHQSGGMWCTASQPSRFFSFRRDRITGRHAAAVWLR